MPASRFPPPKGFAFAIPDLVMLRAWADFHAIEMTIELGSYFDGDDFEEILSFRPQGPAHKPWIMWRTCEDIVYQPLIGKPVHFSSVSIMIESMCTFSS